MDLLKQIPIPGADFQYFASEAGKIYKWDGLKLVELKGWKHRMYRVEPAKYYRRVGLKVNGQRKHFYVQRLVLFAFVGPAPGISAGDQYVACHGPAGSMDNSVPNVYWGTKYDNMVKDRMRDGTYFSRGKGKAGRTDQDK